jgi:hypothetical protein
VRSKNASIARVLPPDYTTIDILTRLDDSIFKQLLKDGTICPTLKRNEISKILRLQRVNADEKRAFDLKNFLDRCRRIVGKRLVVLDGQI